MLGYRAKPGVVIYRVRMRRGDRKAKTNKGIVYGKPTNHGINRNKCAGNLRKRAECKVGARIGCTLRIMNSYWVGQDSRYKWFE